MASVAPVETTKLVADLGIPGLFDVHTHFLPARVMAKVRHQFDSAGPLIGRPWPLHYRAPHDELVATLRDLGVRRFSALPYAHKPEMAEFLNDWASEFADRTPGCLRSATFYPEPGAPGYVAWRIEAGAEIFKLHVQVGGFDPRDPLLTPAWGLLAEAGVPAMVHCGDGPVPGRHTGLDVFAEVLAAHPRLPVVLAHAGMPDYTAALELVRRHEGVHVDTTVVGTAFAESFAPLPRDWPARLVDVADRVVLGTDFPNIPYPYATQLEALQRFELGDQWLRDVCWYNGKRLFDTG